MRRHLGGRPGRGRNVDLLAPWLAPARGACQTEESCGGVGIAGEGRLKAPVLASLGHADEMLEAVIGIDGGAVEPRDEHAVLVTVGKRLDEIVVTHTLTDTDMPGKVAKDQKCAEHGKCREQRQQQRLGGATGNEREHDRARERGDQEKRNGPALAGAVGECMVSRKCYLGLTDFAFAHERESYLILGGRARWTPAWDTLYATLHIHVRNAAGSNATSGLPGLPRWAPGLGIPHAPTLRSLELNWREFRAIRRHAFRVAKVRASECAGDSIASRWGKMRTNHGNKSWPIKRIAARAAFSRNVGRCVLSCDRDLACRRRHRERICGARLYERRRTHGRRFQALRTET